MSTGTGDRRQTPRVPHKQFAQAAQHDDATGVRNEILGVTADMSEGGLRFEAQDGFKEGSEINISFSVGEEIIEADGRVVHFTPRDDGSVTMGIQFVNLSESDQRFIENYCRSKSAHQ